MIGQEPRVLSFEKDGQFATVRSGRTRARLTTLEKHFQSSNSTTAKTLLKSSVQRGPGSGISSSSSCTTSRSRKA